MKRLFAFLSLLTAALTAAPLDELVFFPPDKMPASGSFPGMKNELAPKPGSPKEKDLKVIYPEYKQKGDPEWPSVYFNKPNFNGANLDGWDAFAFSVYNPPQQGNVDLGVCLDGPKKRWTKHIMLEPYWNRIMLPVSEFQPTIGDSIVKFDLFMTRPAKELTLFYERIALVKRNLQNNVPVEDFARLATFDRPQYVSSLPFSFHTLQDNYIGYDWSPFAALSVTTNVSGDVTPIVVTIIDAHGKTSKHEFLQNPGTENTWPITLRKTGLDLQFIRLVTISSTTKNGKAALRAICLHPPKKEDILLMKAPLEAVRKQIEAIPPERRGTLLEDYEKIAANFAEGEKAAAADISSLSQLRKLADSERLLQDWFAKHGRLLDEEYIIAQTAKAFPQSPFGVAVADSMTKVMINDLPLKDVAFANQIKLEMAQNEYESVQIVAVGNREATASITVSPLKNGDYTLPSDAVCVAVVGHVKCEKPPYAADSQGWWPDPILDFQKAAKVAPHEAVSFWLRFKTPKDAKPGIYHANVQILADGKAVASLPLSLHVFDFVLPDKSPLDTATDFRNHIRQVWGNDISQERYNQIYNQCVDKLAEYKIDIDNIYRGAKRGNPQSLGLPIEALKRLRDKDLLRCFNIISVHTPRECTNPDDPRVQEEIDHVLNVLDYWTPILQKENLLKYAYVYGYDEYPMNTFPVIAKVYKAIKAKYPNIPLATTAYDHSFGLETCLDDAVDIFTPLTPRYNPETVARSRAKGHKIWWYICIGPPHPYANWFIEYDAIEARLLMGAMTAKYRPDGFLYYALTRWPLNKKPIDGGPYTDWNPASYQTANGDGSIFCAGPDGLLGTIRSENFRDGLEDYAYVLELEKRTGKSLPVPEELVTTMQQFSRDPKLLRTYRHQLAEAIMAAKP